MENGKKNKITIAFNIILFFYFSLVFSVEYLFKPETSEKIPWERIFRNSPELSIFLAVLIIVIIILMGAQLLKLFCNRFLADIMKLREITFQEAVALILILGVLFS